MAQTVLSDETVDHAAARLKVPPHSVEAEQSVLGGLLLDADAFDRVTEVLDEALTAQGLPARFGIHTGEVELREGDVGGVAVHLAARVMAQADPHEILVSDAVPALMLGSGVTFEHKGDVALKGLEGRWRLHRVVRAD